MNCIAELKNLLKPKELSKAAWALNEIALKSKYTRTALTEFENTNGVMGVCFLNKNVPTRTLVFARDANTGQLQIYVLEAAGLFSFEDWLKDDNTKPVVLGEKC